MGELGESSRCGFCASAVAAGGLDSPSRPYATPLKADGLENPPGGQGGALQRRRRRRLQQQQEPWIRVKSDASVPHLDPPTLFVTDLFKPRINSLGSSRARNYWLLEDPVGLGAAQSAWLRSRPTVVVHLPAEASSHPRAPTHAAQFIPLCRRAQPPSKVSLFAQSHCQFAGAGTRRTGLGPTHLMHLDTKCKRHWMELWIDRGILCACVCVRPCIGFCSLALLNARGASAVPKGQRWLSNMWWITVMLCGFDFLNLTVLLAPCSQVAETLSAKRSRSFRKQYEKHQTVRKSIAYMKAFCAFVSIIACILCPNLLWCAAQLHSAVVALSQVSFMILYIILIKEICIHKVFHLFPFVDPNNTRFI